MTEGGGVEKRGTGGDIKKGLETERGWDRRRGQENDFLFNNKHGC